MKIRNHTPFVGLDVLQMCIRDRRKIDAQISRLAAGKKVEESHLEELRHKLSHINHLMAFHQVLREDMEQNPALYREYRHPVSYTHLHTATLLDLQTVI